MERESADNIDDEMDEEEMEAMLYSQVHFAYDQHTDQGMSDIHPAASSYSATGHVFSVVRFSSKEPCSFSHEESRDSPVSVRSHSDGSSPARISVSSENSWCVDTSGINSAAHDSGLVLDFNESKRVTELSHQGKEKSQKIKCQKDQNSSQVHLAEVVVFSESVSSPFKESASEPKFDLEAELGMEETASANAKSKLKSDDEIDTITINPSRKKYLNFGSPSPSSDFIRLGREVPASLKMKPKSSRDYKKPLKRLLSSHSSSTKVPLKEKIVVVESDSSSSGTSTTTTTTTSSSKSSDISSEKSSDLESDSDLEILDSELKILDSELKILDSGRPETKKSSKPQLDLNWNVNSIDRQTIQIVEKSLQGAAANKWEIDDSDLKPSGKGRQVSRYYAKSEIICHNCKKAGHLSKICPEPKKVHNCNLCGLPGHFSSRCANRVCYNCNFPGHMGADCPSPRRNPRDLCARCRVRGHSEEHCPDHWRQYHATVTTSEELVQKKKSVNPRVYCCNCARRGHFAYECTRERMNSFVYPSYPFIVRYSGSILGQKTGKGKGWSHFSGRHKKFDSDSEPDDRSCAKKMKSTRPDDIHTKQHGRSSKVNKADQTSAGRSESRSDKGLGQSGSTKVQPQFSPDLYPRGSGRSKQKTKVQPHSGRQKSPRSQRNSSESHSLSSFARTFVSGGLESQPKDRSHKKGWKDGRSKKDWKEGKGSYKNDRKEGKEKRKSRSKSRDRIDDRGHSEASPGKSFKKKQAKSPKGKKGKRESTFQDLDLTFYPKDSKKRKIQEKQQVKEKSKGNRQKKHRLETSTSGQEVKFEPLTITTKNGFRTTVTNKNLFRNCPK
ncbi:zinc finger CCHC domain-containing protein 7-like isoform X2 [Littorina saxatilis]|uniref:Zinc finger CCHC domain-containing protein 7 n=1 Tax=Littorina saxatilis TaxID=31220 RepID=A0AAN9BVC3_9CAEN